jgi:predicted PurR-regulated permease PerM
MGMLLSIPIGVIVKVIYEDINYYIFWKSLNRNTKILTYYKT